jgi:hypothetical protein
MTPGQFRTEQAKLRRKLGLEQTLEEIELEIASLPEGQELVWRPLKERKQIEQLRQTLGEQRSLMLREERPPPIGQGASSPSLRNTPQKSKRAERVQQNDRNLWAAIPCRNCGTAIADPETVFCPKCGQRVVDEEFEAITGRMLGLLHANVPALVQRELASIDEFTDKVETWAEKVEQRVGQLEAERREPFSWGQVPNQEKWHLTWGVWGRQILVNIAVMVGLLLIFAAMAGLIGN